ncbi:hypothetical protein P7C73_g4358, partial [Tremellales sp. Uapishka_1]
MDKKSSFQPFSPWKSSPPISALAHNGPPSPQENAPRAYSSYRSPLADLFPSQATLIPGSGVWGPPLHNTNGNGAQNGKTAIELKLLDTQKRLALAEDKVQILTRENARLIERELQREGPPEPRMYGSLALGGQVAPLSPPTIYDNLPSAYDHPGYGGWARVQRYQDPEVVSLGESLARSQLQDDLSVATEVDPETIVSSVLVGNFIYADMHVNYIKPIVWIIANVQPKNTSENAGLKMAVNALATRLGHPRSILGTSTLITAIIELAKPLCFTSCGNYLCQQLLDKGSVEDKKDFIEEIKEDIVDIASDKFGTHVLCKAVGSKELEEVISEALLKFGLFESMKTGARRLWREYLEKCRQARSHEIFQIINQDMKGHWAELACTNEHGSISCQQVFEVFGSQELMVRPFRGKKQAALTNKQDPCFNEVRLASARDTSPNGVQILGDISQIANNQYGHFLISKLIGYPNFHKATCDAILSAYPPVATTHHGVNFVKIALMDGGRASIVKYVDTICTYEEGRTPGIVAIATSSIGRGHLTFVLASASIMLNRLPQADFPTPD